jgi:histidinol-phosphate aminotransferase
MTADDYDSGLALATSTPNTVATRTFSKIYGLASLRLGWGTGPKAIVEALERLRAPFNVSGPAQAAGIAAVRDQAHVAAARAHNAKWMKVAVQRLRGLGLAVVGEHGNFVTPQFATRGKTAAAADAFLQGRGIIARRVESYGLPEHLRISIGDDAAMSAMLDALDAFMGQP